MRSTTVATERRRIGSEFFRGPNASHSEVLELQVQSHIRRKSDTTPTLVRIQLLTLSDSQTRHVPMAVRSVHRGEWNGFGNSEAKLRNDIGGDVTGDDVTGGEVKLFSFGTCARRVV